METQQIFLTQFVLSLVVIGTLVRWYVSPRLSKLPTKEALMPLLIPHTFRYIGLSFAVPQLAGVGLRPDFAAAAAYGDLVSALLAMLALCSLRSDWRISVPLVWGFNTVGMVDLANALRQVDVVDQFGVVWYIPTFIVPVLLVTHFMILTRLVAHATKTLQSPVITDSCVAPAGK